MQKVVEIFRTATNSVCQDENLTADNFQKVLTSFDVPTILFQAVDHNGDGYLSISDMMNFLVELTTPR